MEARELNDFRLGNHVNVINREDMCVITCLRRQKCVDGDYETIAVNYEEMGNSYLVPHVFPIPLTPEILEKCGFNRNVSKEYLWYKKYKRNGEDKYINTIEIEKGEYGYVFIVGNIRTGAVGINIIQHLHQLQNIFYALTNTELPITL